MKIRNTPYLSRLATFTATAGYTGYSPFAPGTIGTVWGIPLSIFIARFDDYWACLLLFAFLLVSLWSSSVTVKTTGREDPSFIIVDEIIGFLVASFMISPTLWSVIFLFLLFRFFDILKPFPINFLDKKIKGGIGVVLDDVVAGIFTNLMYRLLIFVIVFVG